MSAQHKSQQVYSLRSPTGTMSFVCDICLDTLQTRGYSPQVEHERPQPIEIIPLNHHYSFHSFEKSVNEGCFICTSIWRKQSEALREEIQNRYHDINEDQQVTKMHVEWKHGRVVYFEPFFPKCSIPRLRFEFEPMDTSVTPLVSDTTSSKESLQVAQTWLRNCRQHHKACNRDNPASPWYPTRLLHLGELDKTEPNIRLVHTADEHIVGSYMTLSHRWGCADILKLTRDTLPILCERIVFKDMPKTFRDAAVVSKSLDIQYLWIDSLCIIQGEKDLSDWSHEAALMKKVYTFSYCNLSATVSEDSSQGLFRARDPRLFNGPKIAFATRGLETDPNPIKYHIADACIWEFNIEQGILNSRGWVFQERLLAPRVLHFGHDQLFWECRELRACESYPAKLLPFRTQRDVERLHFKDILDPNTDMCMDSDRSLKRTMLYNWGLIVFTYSRKDLTQPSDKLIAISGIAKAVASLNPDRYFAGLWRTDMESQLLWMRVPRPGGLEAARRSTAYRAPTWSWASIDGGVDMNWNLHQGHMMFSVDNVVLEYTTGDTTGCVTGGHIDLRGHLIPMVFPPEKSVEKNLPRIMYIGTHGSREVLWACVYLDIVLLEIETDISEGNIFLMPASTNHWDDSMVGVILLFRLVNFETPLFERIGVARVVGGDSEKTEAILSKLGDNEKQALPCLRFENGLHTIRVV